MNFTRLRLQGFKSFVEQTDLHIGTGMTGIVGPNGCGKSNLVESLRWVMGENSPKNLRGGEMDDVIFGGTAMRPARNMAEVSLELDNTNRTASAEFNDDDTLLVTRQIERGNGSAYRVNGKLVRRRDVQLLFADQSTGSHSTNLVGQGQIDALIRAKPQDRRQILEEAAGTSGLQARRHEAELKLKGAEQNLTRADDVLQSYDTQLRSLKTQVRQASRYRNLANHIRRTEAALLHLRWIEAGKTSEKTKLAAQEAEKNVAALLAVVTQGSAERTDVAAQLPALRQAEAAAAAVVQKLTLVREQLDSETKRLVSETEEQEKRLEQAQGDREREQARSQDGEAALVRLRDEAGRLSTAQAEIDAELPVASEALDAVTKEVEALDAALSQLMQDLASAEARQHSLEKEKASLLSQQEHLAERRSLMDTQRVGLAAEAATRPDLALASAMVDATETELAKRQQQAHAAEAFYREAQELQVQARDMAQKTEAHATKLRAERDALFSLLETHDDNNHSERVLDLITVTPGLENALAIAVGEALTAALNPEAATYWRAMDPLSEGHSLPEGVEPLASFVQAPQELARCLSQIGLVGDAASGDVAAKTLRPGQTLVSRDGWAWRWDGFTLTPKAKTETARRLQQKNRAAALEDMIVEAEAETRKAKETLDEATTFLAQRQEEDRTARDALKAAFAALNDARQVYARQEKESTAITSKLEALDDALHQLNADITSLQTRAVDVDAELKMLPELGRLQKSVDERRAQRAEIRNQQALRQSERDRLVRERDMNVSRAAAVDSDIKAWQERLSSAAQQIGQLSSRIGDIEARLQDLRARPAELDASRAEILTKLSDADARRQQAADVLIATEGTLGDIEQKLKKDEEALTEAREQRVRSEGAVQAAEEHIKILRERMTEKLACGPDDLPTVAEVKEGEPLPDAMDLEQTLARYVRERDNMGPVNLRAETEAEAMQNQIDTLQKEKDDLVAAIAKLRQGIAQLNAEARDRLQTAFTSVNEHFQALFKSLFNGGRAYLELLDGNDPMNAGLEIFASPPGKKMQALSLLSGGERTLTALALLFAVFQTHPSPICVLDEAEAALDESNISRFCELVARISRETGARFLVITHQRVTMAKMDRLYGVTMSEKGVSQLVSVDLDAAVAIRDGEKAEAALRDVQAA
ncbi:MAG: chromosome segregation protein SMC [Alphaproteobacteria bacterium]|nr:chromosome segregation protein SMC [Alphaproteobacteria bacterium]